MLQEGVTFTIWIQRTCWYWIPRILARKAAPKILVSTHSIAAKNFVQEVVALNRIRNAGLELHLSPRGWVKTIKIVHI